MFINVFRGIDADVDPPVNGVITYDLIGGSSNGNNNGIQQLVTVAVAGSILALGIYVASSMITAQYGY
jgi:hypothetical protein